MSITRRITICICVAFAPLTVAAADPPGLEEVHARERDVVRVLCKKSSYGKLDDRGRVVHITFDDQPLTADEVKLLGRLPKLRRLWLNRKSIDDATAPHLAALVKIEELGIIGAPITDASLEHIAKLRKLRTLYLNETKVTDKGLARLAGLPRLNELGVGECGITGSGLKEFTELTHLSVYDTDFNDEGLSAVADKNELVNLYVSDTKITDAGLLHLKDMTSLEELSLSGTKVTDAGLAYLHGLEDLEHIWLTVKCGITVKGVNRLEKAIQGYAEYEPPHRKPLPATILVPAPSPNRLVNPGAHIGIASPGASVFQQQ